MTAAPSRPDTDAVRAAVRGVVDPELPVVTLGQLGVVDAVRVRDDGTVEVDLLPTFAGCPATEMMRRDVTAAVGRVAPGAEVRVRFRYEPHWTPARIDAEGRENLRRAGIAPPVAVDPSPTVVAPDTGRAPLPLAGEVRTCPWCGGSDTRRDSLFGPTPCRDVRWCATCRQPFEAFKDL